MSSSIATTDIIRVFIVDDKEIVRLGLKQLVERMPGMTVVGMASGPDVAIQGIEESNPHVIFVKHDLPAESCATLIRRIKKNFAAGTILMLNDLSDIWSGLESKADGYLSRETYAEVFEEAIRIVGSGGAYIGPLLADYLLRGEGYSIMCQAQTRKNSAVVTETLSAREKEVLCLLAEGKSNEQIAVTLSLSIQTVKVHVKHILKKMKVADRTQAVIKFLTGR